MTAADASVGPSAATLDVYSQWQLDTAQTTFQAAWPTTRGAGQVVAVVDTGVYGAHEDLQGAVLPGADFVGGTGAQTAGDGRYDPNGHGTHVAGIVAARKGNGRGIAGAAPEASILPVRVMAPVYDGNGQLVSQASGSAADVAAGIVWAANNGATVINLSLGSTGPMSASGRDPHAVGRNVPVVAASGNAGADTQSWPAVYPTPSPSRPRTAPAAWRRTPRGGAALRMSTSRHPARPSCRRGRCRRSRAPTTWAR
jgi:subtilisin family serine protease